MKKVIGIALVLMLAGTLAATAQPRGEGPAKEKKTPEQMAQMRTDRMAKELSLTEAQKEAIHKLNLDESRKRETRMNARQQEMQDARKQAEAEADEYDASMKKILTDKQYREWQEKVQKKGDRMPKFRSGNDDRTPHGERGGKNVNKDGGDRKGPGNAK